MKKYFYVILTTLILSIMVSCPNPNDGLPVTPDAVPDDDTSYIIDLDISGSGSVAISPDLTTYSYGDVVEITAIADTGWDFLNWSGDIVETTTTVEVEVTSNLLIDANFSGPGIVKWIVETPYGSYSTPAIDQDGTIIFGADDGKIRKVNSDGTVQWTITAYAHNGIYGSASIASDGTIYFGDGNENLRALNPDGSSLWSLNIGSTIKTTPTIGPDGTIYAAAIDQDSITDASWLYAVNPDGTIKWKLGLPDGSEEGQVSIAADGTLYILTKDKNLKALTPEGTEIWTFNFDTTFVEDTVGCAIDTDGTIYTAVGGVMYAINPDGTKKWYYEDPSIASPEGCPIIASDGTIYLSGQYPKLFAVNTDGTLKWDYQSNAIYNKTTPAIGADGTVYITALNTFVYAFNPDGTEKWTLKSNGSFFSSPTIGTDGTIYVTTGYGELYAIYGESGGPANSSWSSYGGNIQNTSQQILP